MKKIILIAYLNADASSNLKINEPKNIKNDFDRIAKFELARKKAILKHPEVEYYTLNNFTIAFNNEEISDLGLAAVVKKDENGYTLVEDFEIV
jgi:hypothetical protein